MDNNEQNNIRLLIQDKKFIYSPFSPEPELHDYVKRYVKTKMAARGNKEGITLTVISHEPLDEEKFRTAVTNWIIEERAVLKMEERNAFRKLIGLLVFGSIMIMISINILESNDVLKYSLLPILGSLSLSRAAYVMLLDIPTIRAERWILNEMEKKNLIRFEYDSDGEES